MKALLLTALFSLITHLLTAQIDSSWNEEKLTKYFKGIDLKEWEGKSVDSFLRWLVPPTTCFEVGDSKNINYKGEAILHYQYDLSLRLQIDAFRYVNPNGMSRNRQWKNLKREIIAAVQVHNELACLEGCD